MYEVATLWAYANGYIPVVELKEHPIYCAFLLLLTPFWQEFHFFLVHRLLHWPPLYRAAHHLHHKNINPGPWSGLAMHPLEHLLYFSSVLIYWIIPTSPLLAVFELQYTALVPAQGHAGFEQIVIKQGVSIPASDYFHYLHHKYFECNYGAEKVPLDKWFGTLHDGSAESKDAMNKRLKANRSRANS
jgi:sterol desaturase/sphingolipid hydroxylase (fatty acid hydroxylase superfamily)